MSEQIENIQDEKTEMSSMVSVINSLAQDGYTTQFKATKKGICSMDTQKVFKPSQVEIKKFFRFEGESSPDDNSILYAIETKTGEKGTLIDSYGAYNDPLLNKFIREVESIQKK